MFLEIVPSKKLKHKVKVFKLNDEFSLGEYANFLDEGQKVLETTDAIIPGSDTNSPYVERIVVAKLNSDNVNNTQDMIQLSKLDQMSEIAKGVFKNGRTK